MSDDESSRPVSVGKDDARGRQLRCVVPARWAVGDQQCQGYTYPKLAKSIHSHPPAFKTVLLFLASFEKAEEDRQGSCIEAGAPPPNDPAFPEVLKEVYPEYFDAQDVAPNTLHQRITRARDDITAVLQELIKREELY